LEKTERRKHINSSSVDVRAEYKLLNGAGEEWVALSQDDITLWNKMLWCDEKMQELDYGFSGMSPAQVSVWCASIKQQLIMKQQQLDKSDMEYFRSIMFKPMDFPK